MAIDPRIINQLELLLQSRPGVRAHPADWRERDEDFEYLYLVGTLLMRDIDAPAVVDFVERTLDLRPLDPDSVDEDERELVRRIRAGGDVPNDRYLAESRIQGLTRLRFPERDGATVPDLLQELDQQLGAGRVRPEAVLHITGHCCPAEEPEEIADGIGDPYPLPQSGCGCAPRCDGSGVRVSVVDTGWIAEAEHRYWLYGVTGDLEDTLDPAGEIRDYGGHGTFVAGCVRVVAPKAQVHVDGSMTTAGAKYETDLVVQLEQALQLNPDVIVFPFTTTSRGDIALLGFDVLYENVIRHHHPGLAIVAAAGGDGKDQVTWPAAYRWTVAVGALSANWRFRADFSNYGGWVDVFAPGEDLANAYATGTLVCKEEPHKGERRTFTGMARWSGTSFSTPLVGGMIAARMSATGETGRQAADSLLRLARSQAVPGVGPVLLPDQACASVEQSHHCCHPCRSSPCRCAD